MYVVLNNVGLFPTFRWHKCWTVICTHFCKETTCSDTCGAVLEMKQLHVILVFVQPKRFQTSMSDVHEAQKYPASSTKMSYASNYSSCSTLGLLCGARGSPRSLDMGSCVESVTKWHPSLSNPSISCEWRVLCILPRATNRCILQLRAPSCLHSGPFVWRRYHNEVGTQAEFKWGGSEWSSAARAGRRFQFAWSSSSCVISGFEY